MNKELLQQALYALKNGKKVCNFECGSALQVILEDAAIAALESAIAQPEQPDYEHEATQSEPIAYLRFWAAQHISQDGGVEADEGYEVCRKNDIGVDGFTAFPVYTGPQPAPHNLQKRLEVLHLYEEINEHYAKCNPGPGNLRDWVVDRMGQQPEQPAPEWNPKEPAIAALHLIDKLLEIIAATYQIAGAYDAPVHVLDVLANPLEATQEQIDALLPFVPVQLAADNEAEIAALRKDALCAATTAFA